MKNLNGLKEKLIWLVKQRRFWAIVCGAGAEISLITGNTGISGTLAAVATLLAGYSLAKPKLK